MKPTAQEVLDKAYNEASDNGTVLPQIFPAQMTAGHRLAVPAPQSAANDSAVVSHQIQQRGQMRAGDEGFSPYLDVKVFHTAAQINSGVVNPAVVPTCFENSQQATMYREEQTPRASHVDATLPQSIGHMRVYVNTLFQAFKSTALAQDNEKFLEAFKRQEHDNYFVEIAYWEILHRTVDRCRQDGHQQSKFWSPHGKFSTTEYTSFAERFDSIIYTMARNKTVCKALLDAPRLFKLVDDPLAVKNKIDSNRAVNSQKAETMKKGKEVLAKTDSKKRKRGADDNDSQEVSQQDQADTTQQLGPPPPPPMASMANPFFTPQPMKRQRLMMPSSMPQQSFHG